MNEKTTKLIKSIINEFKEYNDNLYEKTTDYLINYGYLDVSCEVNEDNIDEKLEKASDIFEFAGYENYKLLVKLNSLLDEKDKDADINVGTQRIWPARAFTLGHLTHNDLATVRI